jgi:hypothetical protein
MIITLMYVCVASVDVNCEYNEQVKSVWLLSQVQQDALGITRYEITYVY